LACLPPYPEFGGQGEEGWLGFVNVKMPRRRDRLQIAALDARISRDIETRRGDPLDLAREQKEREAWLDTWSFPPF
jgi:hypothetical protein